MTATDKFYSLQGTKVTREEIIEIIALAKDENNCEVIYRLSQLLNNEPETQKFEVETIEQYDPTLNAPRHTGSYKQALDNCGRLRKGWHYVNGIVAKVEKKAKPFNEQKNGKAIVKQWKNRKKRTDKSVSFDLENSKNQEKTKKAPVKIKKPILKKTIVAKKQIVTKKVNDQKLDKNSPKVDQKTKQTSLFGAKKPTAKRKSKSLKGFDIVGNTIGNMIANSLLQPEAKEKVVKNKLMDTKFDTLPINKEWEELMQNPAANMKIAIWGKPKNGKTAGSLQMANYLTKFGKVLYNFADQGFNKSTQDLWISSGLAKNTDAEPSDISNSKDLEKEIATGKYKFVFIDMISDYIRTEKLRPEEFKERFIKQFPNVSFILIFEVTKGGNFKGDQGWTHLVDAIMTVEDFMIENRGRYGTGKRIIWEDGLKRFNPKKYQEYLDEKRSNQPETTTQNIPYMPSQSNGLAFVVR